MPQLLAFKEYMRRVGFATCALFGDFDFADLVTVPIFQNTWLPGDIKMKYVDNVYIAANFIN